MQDVVYFVECGEGGPIKVGVTHRLGLKDRVRKLQSGSPWPLRVLCVRDGDRAHERAVLHLHDADRLCGEWLVRTPEVEALALNKKPPAWWTDRAALQELDREARRARRAARAPASHQSSGRPGRFARVRFLEVLEAIDRGRMRVADIALATGRHEADVGGVCRYAVAEGWLVAARAGRSVYLDLTETGRETLKAGVPEVPAHRSLPSLARLAQATEVEAGSNLHRFLSGLDGSEPGIALSESRRSELARIALTEGWVKRHQAGPRVHWRLTADGRRALKLATERQARLAAVSQPSPRS